MPYLEIKNTRLNSKLIVKFHIESQTYVWFVSHLLLQYSVKDLVKYIIAWSPNGSLIQVTKKSQYSYLQTGVTNNNSNTICNPNLGNQVQIFVPMEHL